MQRVSLRPSSMRGGVLFTAFAIAVAALAEDPFPWGGDVNPGAGPRLIESVEKELLRFVHLGPVVRRSSAAALAKKRAVAAIEGWKRFRNPELKDLARACLDHDDWHVGHRALLWIERLGDPRACELAWRRIEHREAAVREMAALTCVATWNDEAARAIGRETALARLKVRSAAEPEPCVRNALAALERRIEDKLRPRNVSCETVVQREDGLRWVPFLRGLKTLEEVAPGTIVEPGLEYRNPDSSGLAAATRFVPPLLGYGEREEVPRIVVQPFGNLRKDGAVLHTGQDIGACRDGAGFYALADGFVCLISSGSDMGVGIVVQHRRGAQELVNAVYMHAGGTVFVTPGESVSAGQLLGRQGLSFSIENGGQFAHLHLGLYPGPFRLDHNYGYRSAAEGLADWLDPAICLRQWILETSR